MPLTVDLRGSLRASQTVALDLGTAELPLDYQFNFALATGTGADQADVLFSDTRTLSASASENLDLVGSLTNAFGATITFAKVKAIIVRARAANTNSVRLTREGTNGVPLFLAAGDGVDIPPGGMFMLAGPAAAGLATVTAGTGDLLTVANSGAGTGVTYDIMIIGTSA